MLQVIFDIKICLMIWNVWQKKQNQKKSVRGQLLFHSTLLCIMHIHKFHFASYCRCFFIIKLVLCFFYALFIVNIVLTKRLPWHNCHEIVRLDFLSWTIKSCKILFYCDLLRLKSLRLWQIFSELYFIVNLLYNAVVQTKMSTVSVFQKINFGIY